MQLVQKAQQAALDPDVLSEQTARALAQLVQAGTPKATERAMAHALRYWQAWHSLRFAEPLPLPRHPVSVIAVLQFVADHVPRTGDDGEEAVEMPAWLDVALVQAGVKKQTGILSANTIKQRLALLGSMHVTINLTSPLQDGRVRRVLAAVRAVESHKGHAGSGAPVLTVEDLEAARAICPDTPTGHRDRALLTVLFDSGGRRRGEVHGLQIAGCERRPEGYVLAFPRIKKRTNAQTFGKPLRVPLLDPQAQDLDHWIATLADAGITSGPVFVPVRGQKRPRFGDRGLSGHAVNAIVQKRFREAGVKAPYSAHSFRKGFATDRLDRGESYATVQAMTDHADPRTLVNHYFRPKDVLENPAARRSATESQNPEQE